MMKVTDEDVRDRARQALPYFQEARGNTGSSALGSKESDITQSDFPNWVMKIEESARSEVGAEWEDTHFYGIVAETLMDAEEYGEHDWEEDQIEADEMIAELSTDVSVSAYNEELVEWSRESSKWTDVSDDLEDDHMGDSETDLELLPEGMGDDIRRIRYAVLNTIYQQLLDQSESTAFE